MIYPCSVQGCKRPAEKRGWCGGHYFRWRMHGSPEGGRTRNGMMKSFMLSFKPAETSKCIPWPFKLNDNGYGLRVDGRYPHQFICEKFNGERPSKRHEVAHNCGERSCINPSHLRWSTHLENVDDSRRHGTMIKGERVASARLSAAKVLEIRSSNRSSEYFAEKFSVCAGTIRAVKARRTWKHL